MELAERIKKVPASQTIAITSMVAEMRSRGEDVIGFGAGEPDFDTPQNIKDAAAKAMAEGFTKYTAAAGIPELRKAVCEKFERDNGLSYSLNEVIVCCGAKHAIYNLFQVLISNGDEVIIPSPYWVSYPAIVLLAGGVPVMVKTEEKNGFKITAEMLEDAITDRTKIIILNNPCNPTGVVYSRDELESLAEVILRHPNVTVLSDEIYEHIIYDDNAHVSFASLGREVKERTFVLNGCSKAYAMTGWRIGYMAGSEEVISAMSKLQGQSTGNPTSIAQKAALEALTGPQDSVEMMRKEFEKRRDVILSELRGIEGVSCVKPAGAFYVFPNVSCFYGREIGGTVIGSSTDLAEFLLKKAKVAFVPGVAFGSDDHIRLSYATSMDNIVEGMKRIKKALSG